MVVTSAAGRDGLTSIRAAHGTAKTIATPTVVAACFGASLSRLFHETPFEQRLRDVVSRILEGVKDVPKYKDRERQFIFISRGGERALRRNGASILDDIVDAILERRLLRLRHTRFKGKTETIHLKPVSLALHEHQLYVLGFAEKDLRIIALACLTRPIAASATKTGTRTSAQVAAITEISVGSSTLQVRRVAGDLCDGVHAQDRSREALERIGRETLVAAGRPGARPGQATPGRLLTAS